MINKKSSTVLDGKKIAEEILIQLKSEIEINKLKPGLAAILIGDDPASEIYIRLKEKAAQKIGLNFHKYLCNSQCYQDIDEYELKEMLKFLNQDTNTDGIIIQLPLPPEFNKDEIIKLINPKKDVDGFNNGPIIPPTIASVIELLKATKENLSNKKTLIIGVSDIFTEGLEKYLQSELKIKDIIRETGIPQNSKDYDLIIIAIGKPQILDKSHIKNGSIVIDIGINKFNNQTVGDANPNISEITDYYSPVPGGVGPLTVACLLKNTVELCKQNKKIK